MWLHPDDEKIFMPVQLTCQVPRINIKSKTLSCIKNILRLLPHSTDPLSFEKECSLFFSKKNVINN